MATRTGHNPRVRITIRRWDLFDDAGRGRVVLRLYADGDPLSDPGGTDVFGDAVLAGQVAARLDSTGASLARWLETAHAVLQLPAEGQVRAGDFQPARVIDAPAILEGRATWCAPTKPASSRGRAPQSSPPAPQLRPAVIQADRPPPYTQAPVAEPASIPAPQGGHLSGEDSAEWAFADIHGGAGGQKDR